VSRLQSPCHTHRSSVSACVSPLFPTPADRILCGTCESRSRSLTTFSPRFSHCPFYILHIMSNLLSPAAPTSSITSPHMSPTSYSTRTSSLSGIDPGRRMKRRAGHAARMRGTERSWAGYVIPESRRARERERTQSRRWSNAVVGSLSWTGGRGPNCSVNW
jgi:hypothetical protein